MSTYKLTYERFVQEYVLAALKGRAAYSFDNKTFVDQAHEAWVLIHAPSRSTHSHAS